MNTFRADLHCHSTYSDGTNTPEQIIALAAQVNLKGLSITDHDTIDAYENAFLFARQYNISLISGVEFSTFYKNQSIHVLGYSFDLQNPAMKNLCHRHVERRHTRNQAILTRLEAYNMPIAMEELDFPGSNNTHTIGRPHIAFVMWKKGYVTSMAQAFQLFIGENKPCFIPGEPIGLEETIDIIHEAKGVVILAHPHLIEKSRLIKNLLELPFDGIEGYYGRFPAHKQQRWVKIGAHKKWIVTGGSDFHGEIKSHIPLGCSWIDQDTFSVLYQIFQTNNPLFI